MKSILFVLILAISPLAMAAQTVTGFVGKSGTGYYLIPQNSKVRYNVVANNGDVIENLKRLESGDYISGQGTIDATTKKICLDNIDYVGLRKLLGAWIGEDGLMVFQDFSRMKYSPRFAKSGINIPSRSAYQKEFRYTVSPSDGEEWAIFLSDRNGTTFATVQFATELPKTGMTIKIFESESGNIVRTLKLERP